jgi:methionyl aminopeptidase
MSDVTIITEDGWFGDNSRMFIVGEGSIAGKRLCQLTFEAMWKGIAGQAGATLGDIGHAIQTFAESNLSVVREYCGHGIGKVFHDEPQVLHYGRPGTAWCWKKAWSSPSSPCSTWASATSRPCPTAGPSSPRTAA